MKNKLRLVLLGVIVVSLFTLAGCAGKSNENVISGSGMVQFVDIDGGFYGIITGWDEKYEPINLSEDFQQDGLMVDIEATIRSDLVSTHMWGTPIEILHIAKVASG
jgi:hypothetical protein